MIGALSFAQPWLLGALIALPALWWLLKLIPPSPRQINFPPIQFLLDLRDENSSASSTPWWLLALRLFILTLIIVGLSGPQLRQTPTLTGTDKPLLIVVDNGWASAHDWQKRKTALLGLVDEAAATERQIMLVATAPTLAGDTAASLLMPRQARDAIVQLAPQPWATARMRALDAALNEGQNLPTAFDVVWLSDGLASKDLDAFAARLKKLGAPQVLTMPSTTGALELHAPEVFPDRLVIHLRRTETKIAASGDIRARDLKNQTLALGGFTFEPGESETQAEIRLPLEIRNRIARISVDDHASASATFLIDERWRRRAVGIVTQRADIEKPLLSEVYYLEKALSPYAELHKGTLRQLLGENIDTILMPDQGTLSEEERTALENWMAGGGTLVRFASAHLAADPTDLTPVHLRGGNRALGGALSWETPQKLGPFPETSPFWGLEVPGEVTVSEQVLAEPSVDLSQKTWAQLADGTPIVTADHRGKGWLVLFHVTANPQWSNLPLSGLYVEMLRRLIDLSVGPESPINAETLSQLAPQTLLDGSGAFTEPQPGTTPLTKTADWIPSPEHPPGIYENAVTSRALNLGMSNLSVAPLGPLPDGFIATEADKAPALKFQPALLSLAFVLAIIDGFAVLYLAGVLALSRKRLSTYAPLLALALLGALIRIVLFSTPAQAADAPSDKDLQAALETRLAYVITGDSTLDAISKAGLEGLTITLRRRTAAEPGLPFGVDLDRDELAFYPLLYFPVRAAQPTLSPKAVEKLNAYMARGGTLLIDSGDHELSIGGFGTSADSARMRQILKQLDVPPLVEVPRDHVLTKSFYLIQAYPGRWTGGALWVEAPAENGSVTGADNDGVSPIIIGSNDYAAAWAIDENGRPRLPLVPGGPSQREGAMRFGVNLVMYTLTGNYKADQVHVPALLERLGQ